MYVFVQEYESVRMQKWKYVSMYGTKNNKPTINNEYLIMVFLTRGEKM